MGTSKTMATFKCKACGGTVPELPDDATDASIVRCKSCHTEAGTYGSLKSAAKQVKPELKNLFRDMPGTK